MTDTTPLFLSAFLLQNATRPSISYYEDAVGTNARRLTTTAAPSPLAVNKNHLLAAAAVAARRASVTRLANASPDGPPDVLVEEPNTAIYLYGFCLILIPTATILGNLLVIVSVLRFKILHSAINFLILGLAMADLLVAIFVMPYAVYVYIQGGYWFLGELMCDIYSASDVACSTASILLLAVISFDRYRAVSQPIKYSRQSRNIKRVVCILLSIWFFSFALASPIVLGVNNRPPDANPYECRFYNPIFSIVSSVGSFVVPCFVILFVYIRIMIALRKREKAARLRRLANQQAEKAHEKAFESGDEVGELVAGPAVNMMMMALPSMTRRMRRFERHKQAIDQAGDRHPWANHKPINGGGASAGVRGDISSPRELLLSRQFPNSISAAMAAATTTVVGGGICHGGVSSARQSPLPPLAVQPRKTSIAHAARCRLGNFYGRHRRERCHSDSEGEDDFCDDDEDEDLFDDDDEDDEDEDEDEDEAECADQWTLGRLGRRFEAPQLHRVWMTNKEKAALAQPTTQRHSSLCAALLSGDNSGKFGVVDSKFTAFSSLKKNSVEAEDAADLLLQQRHQMALRRRFTKRQRRRRIRAAIANAASTLSAPDVNTNSRAASKRSSAATLQLMGAFSMIARTSIVSFREQSSTASGSSPEHNIEEQQAALVSARPDAKELNNKVNDQIDKRASSPQRPQQLLSDIILSPLRLNGARFSPIVEQATPLEYESQSTANVNNVQEENTPLSQPKTENANPLGRCRSEPNVKASLESSTNSPEATDGHGTFHQRIIGFTSADNLLSISTENLSTSSSTSSIHCRRQVLDTLTIQNIYSLSCPSIVASSSDNLDGAWLLLGSLIPPPSLPPPTQFLPRRPLNVADPSPPPVCLVDENKPLKNASSISYCFGDFPSIPLLPHPTNVTHPGIRCFPNNCCERGVAKRVGELLFSTMRTSSEPEISANPRYTIGVIPPAKGTGRVRRRMPNNIDDDASPENNTNAVENPYELDSICYIDELEESTVSWNSVVGARPTAGLTQTAECCYSSPSTTASISSNYQPYTEYERDLMLSSTPCSSQDSLSDNLNVVTNDFVSEAQTTTSRKESSDEYRLHHKCCALTLLRHSISATGIAASTATTTAMLNHRHRQHGGADSSSCVCGGAGNQFNNGTRRQTDDGVCAHYEGELGDYGKINMNDSDGVDATRHKGKAINQFSRFKKSLRQRARALAINASNRRTSAPPTSPLVQPEHVIPAIFRRFSRRGPLFLRASIISMSASGGASTKPRLRCCDDGTATRDNNGTLDALRHEAALLRRRSESQAATMIVARPPLNRHHHPHHHHYHHYAGHHVVPIGAGSTEAALSAASRHKSCRTGFQKWRAFSADLSDYVPPPCKEHADDNRFNHHHTTLSNAHNNPSEMDARTNAFPDAGNALIRRMVNNSLCIGNYRSGGGGQKLPRGDVTRRTTESSDAESFNDDQQQPPQYHHYQRAAATKFAPLFEEDVVSIADASDVIGPVAPPLPPRMVGICGGGTFDLVIQNAGAHSTIHEEKQKFGDCCPPTVVSVSSNVGNMIPMVTEKYERQQPPPSVKFNFIGDASQATRLPPPPLRRGSSTVEFSSECLTRNSAETSTTNITSSMSSNNHFSESSVSKARVAADASTLSSNNSVTQKQHSTDTLSCSSTGGRSLAAEARRRLLTAERNASPTRLATAAHGDSSNAAVKTLVKKTTINRKESKSSLKRKVTKSQRKEKRATKTLGIVVGIFLICWVPFFSINIINAVCTTIQQPSCEIGFGPFFYSTWIGYMNSFMNPIIYTIFNTEFRRAFKSLILGKNAVKRQQRQVRERRMV